MDSAIVTPGSQWFFDAVRAGHLELPRCVRCRTWAAPAEVYCGVCWAADLRPEPAAGGGHVVSAIRDHRAGVTLALVETDEGPWLATRLLGAEDDTRPVTDLIGRRVGFAAMRSENGEQIPAFRLRDAAPEAAPESGPVA